MHPAARIIETAAPRAARVLVATLQAQKEEIRLKAAQDILNRAGIAAAPLTQVGDVLPPTMLALALGGLAALAGREVDTNSLIKQIEAREAERLSEEIQLTPASAISDVEVVSSGDAPLPPYASDYKPNPITALEQRAAERMFEDD